MMQLLIARCLWEHVDPSSMIFSVAFVCDRVCVSSDCGVTLS